MSADLIIHRDPEAQRWSVFRTGEWARVLESFDTLHEAECYVIEHTENDQ